MKPSGFRRGQRLGKYKLLERLGSGGFAQVYRARDTVEGRDVALKIPPAGSPFPSLDQLVREVRIVVGLEHPNILPIHNADVVDGQLIIAGPLGHETLRERLRRRISNARAHAIYEQILDAVAFAHGRRVIHCDINPNNIILADHDHVWLADFGLARIAARTTGLLGSGSGTVGYIAPEQALGHPSFRSDVFSLGLVGYRLFAGDLPRWPYRWPFPNATRVKRKLTPDAIALLRRAVTVQERKRYRDARQMLRAWESIDILRG